MKSVRCMIREKTINELRAEIERLETENKKLKQNEKTVQEAIRQYQSAISEANDIRDKYTAVVKEVEAMKKSYKKEMDKLLNRIRRDSGKSQ